MRKAKTSRTRAEIMLPDLPQAAVINILQHVPLKQRLALALVCRSWAAAAVLATVDVDTTLRSAAGVQHFQQWLERCAGQLQSLAAKHKQENSPCLLQVPCSTLMQLAALSVRNLQVAFIVQSTGTEGSRRTRSSTSTAQSRALASSSRPRHTGSSDALPAASSPAAAGFLPQLQPLELVDCDVTVSTFQQLPQLSNLTSLTLENLMLWNSSTFQTIHRYTMREEEVMQSALKQLPNLSVLSLGVPVVTPQVLPVIGTMQRLQALSLNGEAIVNHWLQLSLAHFPPTLTALRLKRMGRLLAAAAPRPSNLLQLQLDNMHLQSGVLQSLPKLHKLALHGVILIPSAAGADGVQQPDAERVQDLLAAIGQLAQLRHVDLAMTNYSYNQHLSEVPEVSSFAAFIASSHLTALQVSTEATVSRYHRLLPRHAVLHMLPEGKQLQQLRVLQISVMPVGWLGGDPVRTLRATACIDAPAVRRIAACCPALGHVEFYNVLTDAAAASSLAQLTSLTSLSVGGLACGDAAAAAAAQLTGLRSLRWRPVALGQGQLRV